MDFESFEKLLNGSDDTETRRHYSFSQINQFLLCPRKWFYSYILGIKSPPNMNLVYGSAVHKTVERVNRAWKEGVEKGKELTFGIDTKQGNLPWEKVFAADFSKKILEETPLSDELFEYLKPVFGEMEKADALKLISEVVNETDEFDLRNIRKEFLESAASLSTTIEMGEAHIEEYVRSVRRSRKWYPQEIELNVRAFEEDLGVDLVGIIDVVEVNKNGKKRIKDFKTSSRSYGENKNPITSLQLQMYSLLTGIRNVTWEVFIKTKKPKIQTSRTDTYLETLYSDRDLEIASGKIKMIVTEMEQLRHAYQEGFIEGDHSMFIPCQPYDNWACTNKWCHFFSQCANDCKSLKYLKLR